MLSKNEFEILDTLLSNENATQRTLAHETGLSLGTVNSTLKALQQKGLIKYPAAVESSNLNKKTLHPLVTSEGIGVLKPHEVSNAIILAAGLSTRFAPISYEKPKGLLQVRCI